MLAFSSYSKCGLLSSCGSDLSVFSCCGAQASSLLRSTGFRHAGLAQMVMRLSIGVCLQCGRPRFNPWVGKIPWRRKGQPTPVLLPGKSHRRRSLVQATIPGVAKSWAGLSDFSFSLSLSLSLSLFLSSVVVACGLTSCGTQTQLLTACGILLDQGSNVCPLNCKEDS